MKAYVITITDLEQSVKAAKRCVKSASDQFPVQMFKAITPKDNPSKIFEEKGITDQYFRERFSRRENCMAAFLSHHSLWEHCAKINEEIIVFEHDAVVVGHIPEFMDYTGCVSLGAPSYGTFQTPLILGVNPLTSKQYFPGAHAYRLKPQAARSFIDIAKTTALPTDIFLDARRFFWLQEYYPWPVIAKDSFTTIQVENGCLAKHNWNKESYEIISHD